MICPYCKGEGDFGWDVDEWGDAVYDICSVCEGSGTIEPEDEEEA